MDDNANRLILLKKHYEDISEFLEKIDEEGYCFIKQETYVIPASDKKFAIVFTEIMYKTIPTRTVIFEKDGNKMPEQ